MRSLFEMSSARVHHHRRSRSHFRVKVFVSNKTVLCHFNEQVARVVKVDTSTRFMLGREVVSRSNHFLVTQRTNLQQLRSILAFGFISTVSDSETAFPETDLD